MFLSELQLRFERSHRLFEELVETIPEAALSDALPRLPSNTLGEQLWCVVGARESYTRGLERGGWQGFSCTLAAEKVSQRQEVLAALKKSGVAFLRAFDSVEWEEPARSLALDCLEHEASHQGQLIRYLYALDLEIPAGWRARYALSPPK